MKKSRDDYLTLFFISIIGFYIFIALAFPMYSILSKSFEEKVDTHSISTFDDIGLPPEIYDQPEYLNFSEDKLLLVNDFCD